MHLPRRGVHAAEHDAVPGEDRLRPVLHLLHVAQHAGRRSSRVLHRAHPDRGASSTCGPTCSRTRPTSCTSSCSTAGRPAFQVAARAGRHARRRATASTAASSSARTSRSGRAPRSTSTRRSTRSEIRDWDAPGNITPLVTRVNQLRREHPALQHDRGLRFFATDNPSLVCYTKYVAATASDHRAHRREPRPAHMQHGFVQAPVAGRGRRPAGGVFPVEDLLTGAAVRVEGRVELRPPCAGPPDARPAAAGDDGRGGRA